LAPPEVPFHNYLTIHCGIIENQLPAEPQIVRGSDYLDPLGRHEVIL
jgi:hypothetical protein